MTQPQMPTKAELAADARALVRRALKASLATIAAGSGYPYASLITVATEASGAPVFLISTLAQHTKNLSLDPRASILFDGTGAAGDPLQGARVTLYGKAEKTGEEAARRRFLARHPEAAFMPTSPTSPSGGSRSKAPTISAASAASSIYRLPSSSFPPKAPATSWRPSRASSSI